MKYRYAIRRDEFPGSDDDWEHLCYHAKHNFDHVVLGSNTLFFTTTPKKLLHATHALRIGTTGFDILTTSALEPSSYDSGTDFAEINHKARALG